ncbi:DUF4278 domain-containing protein [Prochlorothrix hollandica]|uniref:DUF4278 domain-containing protein n=1 Tax=Prochlorothrix hollandica PCC 9006 = CALU 1027 TaxID=317619 RepID=A0A0M2PSS5_PROHO|nr:DUF4278 domain-containing protein [Prochlorothrix hollandica]KKI99585.1 hypothetical protein PROH_06595 [Prochlorothrix hollandica PCC 9006 = CALU 1027]
MQLCYRGIAYNHDPLQVATVAGESVQFLGSTTTIRRVDLDQPAYTVAGGAYRGVTSDSGQSLKFLGKSYSDRQIVFVPQAT